MERGGSMHELEDLVLHLEGCIGSRITDGYNPEVKFMSHLWEPIKHVYR